MNNIELPCTRFARAASISLIVSVCGSASAPQPLDNLAVELARFVRPKRADGPQSIPPITRP
jgi:hypothetical protein